MATEKRPTGIRRALPGEPSVQELIEARDRTDAGLRLAMPELFDTAAAAVSEENPTIKFDGLGADAPPRVNPELNDLIVARVDNARVELREAMKLADLGGDRHAHIAVAEEVESVSNLTAVLVQRGQQHA